MQVANAQLVRMMPFWAALSGELKVELFGAVQSILARTLL
jgi:hypothetical protein